MKKIVFHETGAWVAQKVGIVPKRTMYFNIFLPSLHHHLIGTVLRYGLARWLSGREFACHAGETWVRSLGWENALEKEVATHCSILAWEI